MILSAPRRRTLLLSGLAVALSGPALAESQFSSGSGSLSASARLDFEVTIPRILFLRVGTGTNFGANGTIDLIAFTVPAAAVGNGVAIVGSGGDLGSGAVTVRVMGNGGDITLNSATTGPLGNGTAGQTIGWNRILVTPSALPTATTGFTNTAITHPAFNASGGSGTAVTLPASNRLVRQEGRWTYGYANADMVAAGTYGGVGVNNGRVSYTATMP